MIYKHISHAEQFPDSRIEAYIHDPHDELLIGKTLEFSKEWSINGDKVVISVEKVK